MRPSRFAERFCVLPNVPLRRTLCFVAVLSVDLAFRRWSDLGVVILSRAGTGGSRNVVQCEMIPFAAPGLDPVSDCGLGDNEPVDAEILAGRLNHLCAIRNIRVLMLDGPQAWKSRSNGLEHARVSERQLNSAAKTGLPGMVKPLTYRPFAEFCMDVYDALCRRGWNRLDTQSRHTQSTARDGSGGRVLVESYPHAAWKALGLKPLPAKRRAKVSDLAEAYGALRALVPFTTDRPPNHDQLQAIVGGLTGLALEEQNSAEVQIVGNAPHREDGHWREGFIVLPVAPRATTGIRWLN